MIIDRFEGEYAVVELDDKTFVNIPKKALPTNAKEGDVLIVTINREETADREKRMSERLNGLFKD